MISDEKIWTVDGYFNPQNDRVRARCKEDVESVERDKFPGKRMVWLGMSARALTPLVHFKGSVNGTVYREKVLKKVVLEDVLERKKNKQEPIHKRKMFKRNKDMIFEQDFAQPHSTKLMLTRNSWMSIFLHTHPRFGDTKGSTSCFLARSGMIFGPSSDFGESCHSVFTETLDQLISAA